MSLLEAALPRRQIGLIAFNDRLCRSAAELRSVILKARAMALENAKHERAAAAFKDRLLAAEQVPRAIAFGLPARRWGLMAIPGTGAASAGAHRVVRRLRPPF